MDRAKLIIDMLNGRLQRFDNTRNNQWKLNTILWTGMVLVTGFLVVHREIYIPCFALLLAYSTIIFIHWHTVDNIQNSLNWDKQLIRKYHAMIIAEIDYYQKTVVNVDEEDRKVLEEKKKALNDIKNHLKINDDRSVRWKTLQIWTTILISAVSILFLCEWCNCSKY